MDRQIRNAKVESTFLGYESHGILTCFLHLDYGGAGQGFGGHTLDSYSEEKKERIGTSYGMAFIKKILDVLEVEKWEDLPEVHLRADQEHGKVHGIGHILKDQWFYPDKDLKEYIPEGEEES